MAFGVEEIKPQRCFVERHQLSQSVGQCLCFFELMSLHVELQLLHSRQSHQILLRLYVCDCHILLFAIEMLEI